MADFPVAYPRRGQSLTSWDPEFGHYGYMVRANLGTPVDAAFPSANRGIWLPFTIQEPKLVRRLFSVNGTVVAGTVDMGIYGWGLERIVSIGPTTQAGTSALQFYNITDTPLGPGRYYLAISMSSVTGKEFAWGALVSGMKAAGCFQQASVGTLPSSATPVTIASAHLPYCGMELGRVV